MSFGGGTWSAAKHCLDSSARILLVWVYFTDIEEMIFTNIQNGCHVFLFNTVQTMRSQVQSSCTDYMMLTAFTAGRPNVFFFFNNLTVYQIRFERRNPPGSPLFERPQEATEDPLLLGSLAALGAG